MIGKNLIYQIKLAQKMLITQIEIMNQLKKNIRVGKVNFLIILIFFFLIITTQILLASDDLEGDFIEIKILDKVSSKSSLVKLKIGEEKKFKNLF